MAMTHLIPYNSLEKLNSSSHFLGFIYSPFAFSIPPKTYTTTGTVEKNCTVISSTESQRHDSYIVLVVTPPSV